MNKIEHVVVIMQENEVHIIMSDQRMPKITGVELLTKARVGHPQAVRMLFTGYTDLESIIAAINQGHIFRFLKKPWQPEELEDAVREAAEEYERLVEQAEEISRLQGKLKDLQDRVTVLEAEVRLLRDQRGWFSSDRVKVSLVCPLPHGRSEQLPQRGAGCRAATPARCLGQSAGPAICLDRHHLPAPPSRRELGLLRRRRLPARLRR